MRYHLLVRARRAGPRWRQRSKFLLRALGRAGPPHLRDCWRWSGGETYSEVRSMSSTWSRQRSGVAFRGQAGRDRRAQADHRVATRADQNGCLRHALRRESLYRILSSRAGRMGIAAARAAWAGTVVERPSPLFLLERRRPRARKNGACSPLVGAVCDSWAPGLRRMERGRPRTAPRRLERSTADPVHPLRSRVCSTRETPVPVSRSSRPSTRTSSSRSSRRTPSLRVERPLPTSPSSPLAS